MATEQRSGNRFLEGFGYVSLALTVAASLLVSDRAGVRVFGISLVIGALFHHLSGEGVPYGWEGRPPSGYITGWGAVAFDLVMGAIGLSAAIWPDVVLGILGWDQ